jgi:hypothetical protein
MKKIGLLIAFLGLVSGAIYAKGGFSSLKKAVKPVKSQDRSKNEKTRSSVGQSYTYATSEREY